MRGQIKLLIICHGRTSNIFSLHHIGAAVLILKLWTSRPTINPGQGKVYWAVLQWTGKCSLDCAAGFMKTEPYECLSCLTFSCSSSGTIFRVKFPVNFQKWFWDPGLSDFNGSTIDFNSSIYALISGKNFIIFQIILQITLQGTLLSLTTWWNLSKALKQKQNETGSILCEVVSLTDTAALTPCELLHL